MPKSIDITTFFAFFFESDINPGITHYTTQFFHFFNILWLKQMIWGDHARRNVHLPTDTYWPL